MPCWRNALSLKVGGVLGKFFGPEFKTGSPVLLKEMESELSLGANISGTEMRVDFSILGPAQANNLDLNSAEHETRPSTHSQALLDFNLIGVVLLPNTGDRPRLLRVRQNCPGGCV